MNCASERADSLRWARNYAIAGTLTIPRSYVGIKEHALHGWITGLVRDRRRRQRSDGYWQCLGIYWKIVFGNLPLLPK